MKKKFEGKKNDGETELINISIKLYFIYTPTALRSTLLYNLIALLNVLTVSKVVWKATISAINGCVGTGLRESERRREK